MKRFTYQKGGKRMKFKVKNGDAIYIRDKDLTNGVVISVNYNRGDVQVMCTFWNSKTETYVKEFLTEKEINRGRVSSTPFEIKETKIKSKGNSHRPDKVYVK